MSREYMQTKLGLYTTPGELKRDYYEWLLERVGVEVGAFFEERMCAYLHNIVFIYFVPNDDNRAADGVALRRLFIEERHLSERDYNQLSEFGVSASIFEVFVALADRMDRTINNSNIPNRREYFMGFLMRLQLHHHDPENDARWNEELYGILQNFMTRNYSRDGRGGLFPLRKPSADQRKVELWYQMMGYIEENYSLH